MKIIRQLTNIKINSLISLFYKKKLKYNQQNKIWLKSINYKEKLIKFNIKIYVKYTANNSSCFHIILLYNSTNHKIVAISRQSCSLMFEQSNLKLSVILQKIMMTTFLPKAVSLKMNHQTFYRSTLYQRPWRSPGYLHYTKDIF